MALRIEVVLSEQQVVFTNESNIDRFTKARAKAIDSKLGRLKAFMQAVKVPMQVSLLALKTPVEEGQCRDLQTSVKQKTFRSQSRRRCH